jgi:dTDP-4-dehydrorhamnose reductase
MSIDKLVIFGANGMLGRYIYTYFKQQTNLQVISLQRSDYDVLQNNLHKLDHIFKTHNIDSNTIVFNAIGAIPHQSITDNQHYYKINSVFPILLSHMCNKYNSKLIHPTTDCVFSGKQGMYNEDSIHDTQHHYGISKSIGENIDACIIRTSIIGENSKGISLVEWIKSNKNSNINGYTNHYWNGITCLQFAKILDYMITNNIYWNGVKHIYSPNILSKAHLLHLINSQYKLNITIQQTESNFCNRSLTSNYSNIFNIPTLEQQIKQMYNFRQNLLN